MNCHRRFDVDTKLSISAVDQARKAKVSNYVYLPSICLSAVQYCHTSVILRHEEEVCIF